LAPIRTSSKMQEEVIVVFGLTEQSAPRVDLRTRV
jgi:hypothetical protein